MLLSSCLGHDPGIGNGGISIKRNVYPLSLPTTPLLLAVLLVLVLAVTVLVFTSLFCHVCV